jgi:general nucleoside transport system permease protein
VTQLLASGPPAAGAARPPASVWIVLALALLAALGTFIFPYATLNRGFSGEGALLLATGATFDFTGFLSKDLPNFGTISLLAYINMAVLLVMAVLAWLRSRLLPFAAAAVLLVSLVQFAVLVGLLDAANAPAAAQNLRYGRWPFANFGPNLGAFITWVAALVGLVIGFAQSELRARSLARFAGGLVPLLAILFSMILGGIVILTLQTVPGFDKPSAPQGFTGAWFGKLDLLWYAYATLFGPVLPRFRPTLELAGPWLALSQATPLIFTGLGLMFGFRTGLFNIGAAGQIIMGALACGFVGLYLNGPWFLVAPVAIVAAAVGGGLWGALPGWLKARFGSSEVINTIMLNQVAFGIFTFLLSSNQAKFFGNTIGLPFKAPGMESKTAPLSEGVRLELLMNTFGLKVGENSVASWLVLGLIGLLVGFLLSGKEIKKRQFPILLAIAPLVGLLLGFLIGDWRLPVSSSMASARLNFSFILSLVAAALVSVFLWRTKYGYELRAVGLSPKAAEYGGVNIARNTILAMAISGALCGLAATHYVLGGALDEYVLKQTLPAEPAGFGGITMALLGGNTPGGVIASSILFGVLGTGGLNLDQALDKISRDIVTVLQALIVLFIATRAFLSGDFFRAINNLAQKPLSSANKLKDPEANSQQEG